MKPEEILRKAIEKAQNNGWKKPELTATIGNDECPMEVDGTLFSESTIFDHSFAKAFWGEWDVGDKVPDECTAKIPDDIIQEEFGNVVEFKLEKWQYHIQKLVLAEDRLKYIETFLD